MSLPKMVPSLSDEDIIPIPVNKKPRVEKQAPPKSSRSTKYIDKTNFVTYHDNDDWRKTLDDEIKLTKEKTKSLQTPINFNFITTESNIGRLKKPTEHPPEYYSCLKTITFTSKEPKTFGPYAFYNFSGLETISINGRQIIEDVGEFAFFNCFSLDFKRKYIINSIFPLPIFKGKIGASAFENCHNLTDINTHNITEIGASAFKNCNNLKGLALTKIVKVDPTAFEGCNENFYIAISMDKDNRAEMLKIFPEKYFKYKPHKTYDDIYELYPKKTVI